MDAFGFDVELVEYRDGYAPNVVSCRRGTDEPNEYVILGAHLDDIPGVGEFTSVQCPWLATMPEPRNRLALSSLASQLGLLGVAAPANLRTRPGCSRTPGLPQHTHSTTAPQHTAQRSFKYFGFAIGHKR